MSKYARIGSVRACDDVKPDKAQALKILEEAAEVFGAWQEYEETREDETQSYGAPHDWTRVAMDNILDECADVIQAVAGLVHALGVEDFRVWMDRCEKRQRERGRITDGV